MSFILSILRASASVTFACFWLSAWLLLVPAPGAIAAVLRVDAARPVGAPEDGSSWATAFINVQAALDAATPGDEVWVAAGVYRENVTVPLGVALLGGFQGIEVDAGGRDWRTIWSILDGGASGSTVTIQSGVGGETRVDGLVIRNGLAERGGGIYCSNAAPVIANNLITGNAAVWSGAGIECLDASPMIFNNRIVGNRTTDGIGGAGIACRGVSTPWIRNNLLLGNSLGSGVRGGHGGGILVTVDSAASIENNTFVWNDARTGGGISCEGNAASIVNNIIAFGGSGVRALPGVIFRNNCVYGNLQNSFFGFADPTGQDGNISIDPLFVSVERYPDARLQAGSPCRDAGDSAVIQPGQSDLDGQPRIQGAAVDIGAYEFGGTPVTLPPVIVHAGPAGDDALDGASWATSKRTVGAAIELAALTGGEVWVAAGLYEERIRLRHFVYLYGGFAGHETERIERDWELHPTVLDGAQQGTVVIIESLQHWASIDGFTIQHGRADRGAGIYCLASSPEIRNNLIFRNETRIDGGGGAASGRVGGSTAMWLHLGLCGTGSSRTSAIPEVESPPAFPPPGLRTMSLQVTGLSRFRR